MAEKHPFDDFGINLFSECVMKECLPHPIYKNGKPQPARRMRWIVRRQMRLRMQ